MLEPVLKFCFSRPIKHLFSRRHKFSSCIRKRTGPAVYYLESRVVKLRKGANTDMNSKQVNETVNKLNSFVQNVKDGDLRTILENMQKMNDYMAEKLRIYEEHLTSLTGKARPVLTESEKRRLAQAIIKTANEEGIFDPEMVENVVVQCDEYLANIIQTRPLHPEQEIVKNEKGCELRVRKMSKYRLTTWIMHQCGRAYIKSPRNMLHEISVFADKIKEMCNA